MTMKLMDYLLKIEKKNKLYGNAVLLATKADTRRIEKYFCIIFGRGFWELNYNLCNFSFHYYFGINYNV